MSYEEILQHVDGVDEATARFEAGLTPMAERDRRVAEFEATPGAEKPHIVPWQVAASEAFRDCRAAEAIAAYDAHGRFHLGRDLAGTLDGLVDDWANFRVANPGKSTVVLARTHREIDALSYMMRERALAGETRRVAVSAC